MEESTKDVLEKVKEKSIDGRISCSVALNVAREFKVSPVQVGRAANELKIKIFGCQLGCFK